MGYGPKFKIKLDSGRILGPLDLDRIRQLILKNRIHGTELGRGYPDGDWKDINQFPEIAALIIAHAEGRLNSDSTLALGSPEGRTGFQLLGGETVVLKEEPPKGAVQALPGTQVQGPSPVLETISDILPDGREPKTVELEATARLPIPEEGSRTIVSTDPADDPDRTSMFSDEDLDDVPELEDLLEDDSLESDSQDGSSDISSEKIPILVDESRALELDLPPPRKKPRGPVTLAEQSTVIFQNPLKAGKKAAGKKKALLSDKGRSILLALVLVFVGYEFLFDEAPPPPSSGVAQVVAFRPRLPEYGAKKPDPQASAKLYAEAMPFYLADTVTGYKAAAIKFREAANADIGNVKALALLASSYLNLIDSSNKDENFFSVISKLIEMSRAKQIDLPETVIADVEFYITANKPEAAQNRIVEYTKANQKFGLEMFYYLALAYYHRGDALTAARYLGQFPDSKVYSAKIFYLRGQISEKLNDTEAALAEYDKAIKFNPGHARSRLRIAEIENHLASLKTATPQLEYLVTHPALLAPKELAQAYYLHSQLSQQLQRSEIALADMERATRLDRDNHDFLLELYTLRAKAGSVDPTIKRDAKMYFFLGEGERLLRSGRNQEALTQFLLARQAKDSSPLPLVKIGDMFTRLHDLGNAKVNYKLATDRAPKNIDVWTKYIDVLIESYEWEEAQKAMDRFRKLPVHQSAIDKAAADLYAKQGRTAEAQTLYRKAMSRDSIDSSVYTAYAKSLMVTKNFKEAPFFFALALRFDPLNLDALVGTARCVAATESIDRAITMLEDELQKGSGAKAEILAAIAEFYIQKGSWEQAQQFVEQARQANPEYAYPWKLQAQIYMNREGLEKNALDKASAAYQSYSERNASDPSGYLERYRIFVKKTEFEKAGEELSKIYGIYPRYPNLHFYKGALYAVQANYKVAIEEFQQELKNNPSSVQTLLALGRSLIEVGGVADGLKEFQKAMLLAPRSADAKQESGYANYLLKNYPGAIALFKAALVFDPANPLIYKRLGLAYREGGDTVSASEAFKKYLEMEPDAPDKAEFEKFR